MTQTSTSFNQRSLSQSLVWVTLVSYAVEFGKKMHTIGFDLSVEKVEGYRRRSEFALVNCLLMN